MRLVLRKTLLDKLLTVCILMLSFSAPAMSQSATDLANMAKRLKEGMPEERVESLIGKPSASSINVCGSKSKWNCKLVTYASDSGDTELTIWYDNMSKSWMVNQWDVKKTGRKELLLECSVQGSKSIFSNGYSGNAQSINERITLDIHSYSKDGTGSEYFSIKNPVIELTLVRFLAGSPPTNFKPKYSTYSDYTNSSKYDFNYEENFLDSGFNPLFDTREKVSFELDRRTGDLRIDLKKYTKYLNPSMSNMNSVETTSIAGNCSKVSNKPKF
jgi:hypothetical protein